MSSNNSQEYRTVRGYQSLSQIENLSTAMEDYLEMIARFCMDNGTARIGELSDALHVKPSSSSKMVTKLKNSGLVTLDTNRNIYMTSQGKKMADYLLFRHEVIQEFLVLIGSENALEETELIEHFLSPNTVDAIKKVLPMIKENTDFKNL